MKIVLSSVIVLVAFFACSTAKNATLSDPCLEMEDSIASFWKYDSLEFHYIGSHNWLEVINFKNNKFRDCLLAKDSSYIVKLFGDKFISSKAKDSSGIWIIYNTSKPCSGRGKDFKCSSLKFLLNSENKVKNVIFEELLSFETIDRIPVNEK